MGKDMNFKTIEQVVALPVDQILRILEAQLEILKVISNPPMVIKEFDEK